ncbi:MAG: DUF2283 domain-containing protein [Dehalococcoidales bacterium]|nr:DUF2283 domain-containing protein [Dehalococcoidales bacterium]
MKFKYDQTADAIYITLSNKPYAYGKDLDDFRRVDYDKNNNPRGIELLCVSNGVVTEALSMRVDIERELDRHGIKVYA